MKQEKIKANQIKQMFKSEKELNSIKEDISNKEGVPTGCLEQGMRDTDSPLCDLPRCHVCRRIERQEKEEEAESMVRSERREERKMSGFYAGTFKNIKDLPKKEKEGKYAFIGDIEDPNSEMEQYVLNRGIWKKVEQEKE